MVERYPQSAFRPDAKLAIGDTYILENTVESKILAINEFTEFLSFFPTHRRADYAQLRIGYAHFRQMLAPQRDQTETREAIHEFAQKVHRDGGRDRRLPVTSRRQFQRRAPTMRSHSLAKGGRSFSKASQSAGMRSFILESGTAPCGGGNCAPHGYTFLIFPALLSGVPAREIRFLAGLYGDPRKRVVSFWCMGMNQHTRGTWINNLVYNLYLLTGKIASPGNSPFSHRLPADIVVTNPDTQSGTLTGAFTYNPRPAPTLSGVAPATGAAISTASWNISPPQAATWPITGVSGAKPPSSHCWIGSPTKGIAPNRPVITLAPCSTASRR